MVYRSGKQKPMVEIVLTDGQQNSFIPSYTSLDEIKGEVSITVPIDTQFDQIYITFEGIVKTYVEKIATSSPTNGRTEAFQCFLRLVQPLEEDNFPESNTAKAGQTYKFPFTFVIPERLLPQACDHPRINDSVQQAHLQLPPSLGDPLTAVIGKAMMDDMAPDMGVVSYAVKARIINGRNSNGKHNIIADSSKKVRVIPAVPEQPPLNVLGGADDDYKLRKEKCIRKGTFKGKLGTLVMESAQTRSLRLPFLRAEETCPVTTMATVNLRFDPSSPDAQPPRLNSLSAKLKVITFFASTPMREIPHRSTDFHYNSTKGAYVENLSLSSRCMASAQWDKHHSSNSPARRGSSWSTVSSSNPHIPEPSASYKQDLPYYTTHLLVPITLPKTDSSNNNKTFVPTFHSCLISRVYALDLYLSCHTPGTSVTDPNMHLKLPIQISAEGNADARPNISQGEQEAIARREAATFEWHPRSVAPPSPEYTERAQLAAFAAPPSPEYTEPATTTVRSSSMPLSSPEYREVRWAPTTRGRDGEVDGRRSEDLPPDYSVHRSVRPNAAQNRVHANVSWLTMRG